MSSCFILFLLLSAVGRVAALPPLCSVAERWSINGRAFVDEFRGKVLVLAIMRLDCPMCGEVVQRCDAFMRQEAVEEHFAAELQFIVVAQQTESSDRLTQFRQKYPHVRVVRETPQEPLWGWLRASNHDGLVFDRCGRFARNLRFPQRDISSIRTAFNEIKAVIHGQPCGHCAYDVASVQRMRMANRQPTTTAPFVPQITAYMSKKKPPQTVHTRQEPRNDYAPVNLDYRKETSRIHAQQQQPGVFNNEWAEIPAGQTFGSGNGKIKGAPMPTKKDTVAVEADPAPVLYPDSADNTAANADYYDYVGGFVTESPQDVQIPKPTLASPSWPTRPPGFKERAGNFGSMLANPSSCVGFTDELCFQQDANAENFPCCKGRIVLTDQCVPGKCSNVTQQLCCIQKFLQAKHACCYDERQSTASGPTDAFSRCCYEHFVLSDDPCCNQHYATAQWKAVHELCLPNVEFDLSPVKVKIMLPGTSVQTDFDFGQNSRWKFECKHGGHVSQYSYFGEVGAPYD